MASVVCQGLQSCLDPHPMETLTVSPNLASKSKVEDTNWSFIKALETPSNNQLKTGDVYVHPLAKRSASALSSKSLEMCTESLGSETGSESGDEFWEDRSIQVSKPSTDFDRKVSPRRGADFPPPLTSISGSEGTVKVKHHRAGGRLVMKAVCISNCGTNFQTERANGRLRLSLLRDCSVIYESGGVEVGDVYNEEGGEVESEDEYVTSEDEEEEEGGEWGWAINENRGKVGGEIGIGEVKRLTRCNEGGNGNKVLANWGSYWVPIS